MGISSTDYAMIQTRQQKKHVGPFVAIDPGNTHSAVACFDDDGAFTLSRKMPNEDLLRSLLVRSPASLWTVGDRYYRLAAAQHIAIEGIACYGMSVGAEVFETCFWSGRFVQAWGRDFTKVYRKDVKLHLCHSMRAKDSNIRQSIIDRYGGKEKAIGRKKTPGPLYGVSADQWAAIAVGLYFADTGGSQ